MAKKYARVEVMTTARDANQLMTQSCHGNGLTELEWCKAEQEYRRKRGEECAILLDNKNRCQLVKVVGK